MKSHASQVSVQNPVDDEVFDGAFVPQVMALFGTSSLSKVEVYNAFVEKFGALVVYLIGRHNKVTANRRTQEIAQEIFLRLRMAKVIERFLEQAHSATVETLTGEQAHRALGVSWETFSSAVALFVQTDPRKPWMAVPASGSADSKDAVYRTESIMELSVSGYFEEEFTPDHACLVPAATSKHFQNYISRAVHNLFKNFCRSEDRHNRERIWDNFPELRSPTEDNLSWEHRLPDSTQASQEMRAEIALLVRRIRETPAAPHVQRILEMMTDGSSLEDAIRRIELQPHERRRTLRVLHPWIQVASRGRASATEEFAVA